MKRKLRELLAALATDSRVLADYQNDPRAMRARFGVSERDFEEFTASLGERVTAASGPPSGTPVTH